MKPGQEPIPDDAVQASGGFYFGWVVVIASFFVLAINSPLLASFSMFYVPVLHEFHWTREKLAIAMAIHLVISGVAGPVAGGLVDRYQARRVMPIGSVLMGVALLGLSQATALWHFYLAFGIAASVGSALIHITPLSAIVSNWFVRHRGTALGILAAGSGAGQLTLLPSLQYLIDHIGWRNAYLTYGAVILVIPTILILLFLHSRPADCGLSAEGEMQPRRRREMVDVVLKKEGGGIERKRGIIRKSEIIILDQEWAETNWTIGKAIRTFRFWALTLMVAMYAAGFFIISSQLVLYLTDKGYSAALAAAIMGFQGFTNMAGKFFGGFLCDRIGREKTLTMSIFVFVAGIALLNLGGAMISPLVIYAFALCYGMGYGMTLPALVTSSSDLFQGKHFGSILGVILLGGFLGGAIGTWLGGKLFDVTHAYHANFLVAALTMATSALLVWKARPSRVRFMKTVQVESLS